jgi:two-component system, chemotaxis family, response regulator Rcp1
MQRLPRFVRDAEILLVDDNPDDIEITLTTFKNIKLGNAVHVCNNGAQALSFLNREGKHKNALTPDLIFLDINMPVMDGHETLVAIKKVQAFSHIPIIMLTSSGTEENIFESYNNEACCFLHKPLDWPQLKRVVKVFDHFSMRLTVSFDTREERLMSDADYC